MGGDPQAVRETVSRGPSEAGDGCGAVPPGSGAAPADEVGGPLTGPVDFCAHAAPFESFSAYLRFCDELVDLAGTPPPREPLHTWTRFLL
jgi:hypothetical protein